MRFSHFCFRCSFWKTGRIYALILVIVVYCFMVQAQFTYKVALKEKCLHGHQVRSLMVNHRASDCFVTCWEHCLCVAFQIVDEIFCQLLSTSRFITPSSLVESPGCVYYDVVPEVSHFFTRH